MTAARPSAGTAELLRRGQVEPFTPEEIRSLNIDPDLAADDRSGLGAAPGTTGASGRAIPLRDLVMGLVDGTTTRPLPSLLHRSDGAALLYRGRVNWLFGPPGAGKSWIGLVACAEVIESGGSAVYVDWEDDETLAVSRLLALGSDPAAVVERFRYIRPVEPTEKIWPFLEREVLVAELVVLDATTESMAIEGFTVESNAEAALWINRLPRRIASLGPAVLVLDHVPKSDDAAHKSPLGAQHKKASADGAVYSMKQRHEHGWRHSAEIILVKDRPGGVDASGRIGARFTLDQSGEDSAARLEPPISAHQSDENQPEVSKRADALYGDPDSLGWGDGISASQAAAVLFPGDRPRRSQADLARRALKFLVVEGKAQEHGGQRGGPGGSRASTFRFVPATDISADGPIQ